MKMLLWPLRPVPTGLVALHHLKVFPPGAPDGVIVRRRAAP